MTPVSEMRSLVLQHIRETLDREIFEVWLHGIDYKSVPLYDEYINRIKAQGPTPEQARPLSDEEKKELLKDLPRTREFLKNG